MRITRTKDLEGEVNVVSLFVKFCAFTMERKRIEINLISVVVGFTRCPRNLGYRENIRLKRNKVVSL